MREEDKEQRRLYALAVDMLGAATLDGRFKELSPSWERTLGFSRQELMARPYLEFIHPEDKARTLSETDTFSTGAQTITYENRFLCKDGSYRWLEWNAMLALDEGLVYFVARDVTRRKTAESRSVSPRRSCGRCTTASRTTWSSSTRTRASSR